MTTNQNGIHCDLEKIIARYNLNYQRPISDFSLKAMEKIETFIGEEMVVFDFGCGIGESSFWLAKKYPEYKIVGIDKSISRLHRNNNFKKELLDNVLLIRGELLDLLYLIYLKVKEKKFRIFRSYFLYPNPWPKKHHVKRRFHANPIIPFIFELECPLFLRSNWKLYLEEFEFVAHLFKRQNTELKLYDKIENITPFEKKYSQSQQPIYQLIVHHNEIIASKS